MTSGRLAITIGIERHSNGTGRQNWPHGAVTIGTRMNRCKISVNPAACHGRACVRGTRVLVSAILDNVSAGVSREEILWNYAVLTGPDIDCGIGVCG